MQTKATLITAAAMLLASVTISHGQDTGNVQFRIRLHEGQSFRSEMVIGCQRHSHATTHASSPPK